MLEKLYAMYGRTVARSPSFFIEFLSPARCSLLFNLVGLREHRSDRNSVEWRVDQGHFIQSLSPTLSDLTQDAPFSVFGSPFFFLFGEGRRRLPVRYTGICSNAFPLWEEHLHSIECNSISRIFQYKYQCGFELGTFCLVIWPAKVPIKYRSSTGSFPNRFVQGRDLFDIQDIQNILPYQSFQ